jgi:hypothetical protein
MTPFTAFNPDTGEVLYSGTADSPQAIAELPGVAVVEGEQVPCGHYRDGDAWTAVPAQPSPAHSWDWTAKAWHDPRTIEQLRAQKWEQVKTWRAQAIVSPAMTTPYGVFNSDAQGVSDIKDALLGRREAELLSGSPLAPIGWTLKDNSVVSLTTDQLGLVAVMLLTRGDLYHQRARALRQRIYDEATTAADLELITRESLDVPLPQESTGN